MVGFDIEVNGRRHCLAALREGVVSAFVVHADLTPDPPERRPHNLRAPTTLSVTGITAAHHAVHWRNVTDEIRVGDVITIRIVDTDHPDPPTPTPQLPDLPPTA